MVAVLMEAEIAVEAEGGEEGRDGEGGESEGDSSEGRGRQLREWWR